MQVSGNKKSSHRWLPWLTLALLALVLAPPAQAQPFGGYLVLNGDGTSGGASHGYIQIPHSVALNPTGALTIEMWVKLDTPQSGCRSLFGKDYTEAYWVGICGSTLRSYLKGSGSVRDGGNIPDNAWTHIAVVFNGTTRLHYVNGVQVGAFAETAPLTTSTDNVRIGSDASYFYSPNGAIDEVRLWNVARTAAQIESTLHTPITSPATGLVAVWSLNGNGNDIIGGHDGTVQGNASFGPVAPPAGPWLSSSDMPDFRFKVRLTTGGVSRMATQVADCIEQTVCAAGVFPDRPEVLLRVIGPRPNGYLWPIIIRFTNARVEVWVEQLSTGDLKYYDLPFVGPDSGELNGINDRFGFQP
jgi:hypothetical protein